jgi:hypothetical protein
LVRIGKAARKISTGRSMNRNGALEAQSSTSTLSKNE